MREFGQEELCLACDEYLVWGLLGGHGIDYYTGARFLWIFSIFKAK